MAEAVAPNPTAVLEEYFAPFRKNIIGEGATIQTPFGKHRLLYADWIASGRLYEPIEQTLAHEIGPLVGNTHSEASYVGEAMTLAYKKAHAVIKQHVHANEEDVILTVGSGMTSAVAKFQRILGLKIPESYKKAAANLERPVVFITHMEHHSNQTSWLECEVDVVVVPPGDNLLVDARKLEDTIKAYAHRKVKIGAFTACSNVTGIGTPYHELAVIMHRHGGLCFIDFAASAPYANMDMHPENPEARLDAIYFSPHKFLGGPGSAGVLVFNRNLYTNKVPDQPGGGTVLWTNPWGEHHYFDDIETREDGGTPAFLQTIKAALAIRLKEKMGVANMAARERSLVATAFARLSRILKLHILAPDVQERIGVISFYVDSVHYNFIVRVLSDHFGVQVRGGCSCAGTYGHYLLHVTNEQSRTITEKIDTGDLSLKPGWVRLSLHPVMTNDELDFILEAIEEIARHPGRWEPLYAYDLHTNEFRPKQGDTSMPGVVERLFR
jgi:selenocysteine lyase/cysteine desulfurase